MKKRIAVFAGNSFGVPPGSRYFSLAYRTGQLLAKGGFTVVTGGGPGLMDEVMRGAYENGGDTIGIRLIREGVKQSQFAGEKSHFFKLRSRQERLLNLGDGFIALPGGIGTFFEIFEVLGLKRKKEIPVQSPLVVLGKYFETFDGMIGRAIEAGFMAESEKYLYTLVYTPEEALHRLKTSLS